MGTSGHPDTDQLLALIRQGDPSAVDRLLGRHRERLKRMVAVRIDQRLAARLDPSDVVQEALAAAAQQLPAYLLGPERPFYPWLRQIAWNRLVDLYRHHILAQRRAVDREEPLGLTDTSAMQLAEQLLPGGSNPVGRVLRTELRQRVKDALGELPYVDREILTLRHLEQLSLSQCGEVLGIATEAAKKRYARAVLHLQRKLGDESWEMQS